MVDSIATEPSVESTLVMCDFSNVFSEEIISTLLPRKVDFCIDLASGDALIYKGI